MEILLDPNIAYLLLVIGMLFALIAILMPGTGVPELLAVFAIVLAGYAVYHLSLNWWALVILILSLVPFILAIRSRGPGGAIWLVLAIVGLTVGSVFFFPAEGALISVHPALAAVTTILYSVFLWVAVRKVVQIARTRPMHELAGLIGQQGEAKTPIADDGTVQVAGELWSARSARQVDAGNLVKVIGRDGFILLVEKDAD